MPKSILARSERYQRLALYGVSTLLTAAILLATWLFGVAAFRHFQEQQVSRFVQYREQVKAETDELSARLMQFVDLYEGIWGLHDHDSIPLAAVRTALRQGRGIMRTDASLTATPFSIVSDLSTDKPEDRTALAMQLRIVRELSAAPSIDTRKLGINLSGYLYSPDYRFIASVPPQAQASTIKAAITSQSAGIEAILAPYSVAQLRHLRPFWTSQSDFGGPDTISRIILPMLRDGKRVATIVVTVPEDQFFRVFLKNQRIPGFFLLDNASHAALGYDPGFTGDRALFEAVNADFDLIANAHTHTDTDTGKQLQSWRRGMTFFISQRIEGPGWSAVLAYDWHDVLRALESTYIAGALLCLAVLVALWSSVIYFEYRVARPMRLSATRLIEVKQFNRTIIDTLPIGIAVFDPVTKRVLLENAVAADMLERHLLLNLSQQHAAFYHRMRQRGIAQGDAGLMLDTSEYSHLGVVCRNTRWSGRDVVLIGLVDMSERLATEQKLRDAVAEAERANRAKTMFLGLMSHEIRTPLHGAMGHLELLSHARLDSDDRERVALINHSFEALLTQVNDILDLTKIEVGVVKLNLKPVRLSKVIEHAAQNFSAAISGKGLGFWCTTDPALDALVMADEQRLTQILQNLLGNACKFTETGAIVLRGVCIDDADKQIKVRLSVEDSGIGIPVEQQARIFKPLTQADASISARYGGTGLGLYLCRDLTSLMGGNITIDSSPGCGSAFHVTVSFAVVSPPTREHDLPDAVAVALHCTCSAWEHALRARLEAWGCTVLTADQQTSGRAFIHLVAQAHEHEHARSGNLATPDTASIFLSPCGPLVPVSVPAPSGVVIRCTSLSCEALLRALVWAAGGVQDAGERFGLPAGPTQALPGASSLDVIVAEDNPISLTLIVQQLQSLGIDKVRTAANGFEAIALWQQRPADVLISDWQMPECDGLHLLQEIRARDPSARVVVTTALADGDLETGEQVFNAILHKPIRLADLQKMLRNVCGKLIDAVDNQSATLPEQVDPQLLRMLADSWEEERQLLNSLIAQRDAEKLRRRLHRLQGGLLAIGLNALAAQSKQLQDLLGAENWTQTTGHYQQLLEEVATVLTMAD